MIYHIHLGGFAQRISPKDGIVVVLANIQHPRVPVVKMTEVAPKPHGFFVVNHGLGLLADRIHGYVQVQNGVALDNVAQFLHLCTPEAGKDGGERVVNFNF